MNDIDRLKGFYKGVKELEDLLKEALDEGDDAKAAELRKSIQGSLRGIEKWLVANNLLPK